MSKEALLRELKAFAISKGKEIPQEKYVMDFTNEFLDKDVNVGYINPGRYSNGFLFAKWKSSILNSLEGISQSDFDKYNETEDLSKEELVKKIELIE